ncbi:MAG: 3-deoxy-D-manno-octulosonic acid transferase [Pseudomonadota bacterium]
MLFFYNLIQILGLIFLWPLALLVVACKAKYRLRIPKRLGVGLDSLLREVSPGKPRIWIHALSVGEVISAVPFVRALRAQYPGASLLFSAATSSGQRYAENLPDFPIDVIIPFPLDFYPVAFRFIRKVRPDLFILIETDFWPNFLHGLQKEKVPALLVNGRVSQKSYTRYSAFQPFFLSMFNSFQALAMQRRQDMEKMVELGVDATKLMVLGNLKYDAVLPAAEVVRPFGKKDFSIDPDRPVFIAGSTHDGEEEMLCSVFQKLLRRFPRLFMVIAPRNIERADAVAKIVQQKGFSVARRSAGVERDDQVMVLDTMGELAGLYAIADLAFVGGSMVDQGGHNPLEPAVFGVPVFFGVHMEDFADVAEEMIVEHCAEQVETAEQLMDAIRRFLESADLREKTGDAARVFVSVRQGVNHRHIELVERVLS